MEVKIYNGFKKYYRIYECTCGQAKQRWADGNWPNCCEVIFNRELQKSPVKKIRQIIWQKIEKDDLSSF
tara:strand:- start:223 stop:429 length:207 start_codon:yes stop_codon:yes gene_type:complete